MRCHVQLVPEEAALGEPFFPCLWFPFGLLYAFFLSSVRSLRVALINMKPFFASPPALQWCPSCGARSVYA